MDESTAREQLIAHFGVSRETLSVLEGFVEYLNNESESQNLVSRGTLSAIWSRHILDSAQLLRFCQAPHAKWIDLGSGAGFPGLMIGLLHPGPVTLVEERKKRVEFLREAASVLGIRDKVEIHCSRIERVNSFAYDVITARAFAPLDKLLNVSHRFSTAKTRWILPKGKNAAAELDAAASSWHGEFRLEQSITDSDAMIIVAEGVSRVGQPKLAKRVNER